VAAKTGELTDESGDTTTSDHIVFYSIYLLAFSYSVSTPRPNLSDALTLSLLIVTGQELFFIVNDNLGIQINLLTLALHPFLDLVYEVCPSQIRDIIIWAVYSVELVMEF